MFCFIYLIFRFAVLGTDGKMCVNTVYHVIDNICSTFTLGDIINKQVLRSSSKITSLGHHGLLYGIHPIDDYCWFRANKDTVDVSIRLPQLGGKAITSTG